MRASHLLPAGRRRSAPNTTRSLTIAFLPLELRSNFF
jgi:hypothetical protein